MNFTDITGLILAGGRGTRMGNQDKGLVCFHGKPLIEHVLTRFRPQVNQLIISANRNVNIYGQYGCAVVGDHNSNYDGPLAGIQAGLHYTESPLFAIVPCDMPFLPVDLVQQLHVALLASDAGVAVAEINGTLQPLLCLLKRTTLNSLDIYLANGERKVMAWLETLQMIKVEIKVNGEAVANINSQGSL